MPVPAREVQGLAMPMAHAAMQQEALRRAAAGLRWGHRPHPAAQARSMGYLRPQRGSGV